MRFSFLFVAFVTTVYAAASWICDFSADFTVSALIAILALGAFFAAQERGRL